MSSSSRGARKLASSIASSQHVCLSCRQTIARRQYASVAIAHASVDVPPTTQMTPDLPAVSPVPQPRYIIKAGVVLSRPPLITPDLHPFQKAYYLYMRRLNERLVLPFSQYFYYKRGTPSFEHWRTKRRERGGVAARDIGKYNAYTKESWNDEVLIGNTEADPENIVKQLIEEEGRGQEYAGERGDIALGGLRRTTEADEKNDQRSLERALGRTLYLLIKRKGQSDEEENRLWTFPNAPLEAKEGLKEGAQRILNQSCGVNMNTWFVGNHPVGHLLLLNPEAKEIEESTEIKSTENMPVRGDKIFFMKARIMAGQADLDGNRLDVQDFKWLAKNEIEGHVHPYYWSRVKNMLADQ